MGKEDSSIQRNALLPHSPSVTGQPVLSPLELSQCTGIRRFAQQRNKPGRIMGACHIHQIIKLSPGIVLLEAFHQPNHSGWRAPAKNKLQQGIAQRVIGNGIQFAAHEILPPYIIADLIGRILPYLSKQKGIRFFLADDVF